MGMFDFGPVQRSAGIQQAFDQLGQQLNFGAQQVNLKDPASLRAKAQEMMDKGDTAEAQKFTAMADALETKQKQGQVENIKRTYEQVKGTKFEEQWEQAMKESGNTDIVRAAKAEDISFQVSEMEFETAKDELEAKALAKEYSIAKSSGNVEAIRDVEEKAKATGNYEAIEAYRDLEIRRARDRLALRQAQNNEAKDKRLQEVKKLPLPKTKEGREAMLKRAKSLGLEDEYMQRITGYDDYMESTKEMDDNAFLTDFRYTADQLAEIGMSHKSYLASIQGGDAADTNRRVRERFAAQEIEAPTDENGNKKWVKADVEAWQEYLKNGYENMFGYNHGAMDVNDDAGGGLARDAATLQANGIPTAVIETYIEYVNQNPANSVWVEGDKIYERRPDGETYEIEFTDNEIVR